MQMITNFSNTINVKPYLASSLFYKNNFRILKNGVWVYFFLLIFEGALRKWFLPEFANPLLIIRDPIALWLLIRAYNIKLFLFNAYIVITFAICFLGIIASLLFGHGNLAVSFFGARIFIIHFPLIFIIGKTFNWGDVIKLGKVTLWISIPMIFLIIVQFYSPQSAWVNRGIGGNLEGAGFAGALGYFRPPGTFSFTNGNTLFFGFVAAFVIYFWISNVRISRFLLITSSIAMFTSIPFSISRTLFFELIISLIFAAIAIAVNKKKYLKNSILTVICLAIVIIIISHTSFAQIAGEAFLDRFTSANEEEGGLRSVFLDRFLGGMIEAFQTNNELPFFGYGIGMGTNVGSILLTGQSIFLISEGEWGRLVGELGLLFGIIIIAIRILIGFQMIIKSYNSIKAGNVLAWMLLSFAFFNIIQGQWAQPTALGFAVLGGGLVVASLKKEMSET